jgi:hypothetical protein
MTCSKRNLEAAGFGLSLFTALDDLDSIAQGSDFFRKQ